MRFTKEISESKISSQLNQQAMDFPRDSLLKQRAHVIIELQDKSLEGNRLKRALRRSLNINQK